MNVLAVRQDNNGDVLLAGPALRALAAGSTRLTLLCGPSGRAAAEALPNVDDVVCFEANWIEAEPRPIERETIEYMRRTLAAYAFDRAVIFTSFHQSPLPAALILRMAGVPWVAAISEDYPGALLDVRHRNVADDIHEVERGLSLAQAAGFELPAGDDGRLRMSVADHNPVVGTRPYIVVHPGATVPARAWHPSANRDLVRALAAAGERVVVTGGPQERELCAFVAGDAALNLAASTNLPGLARVIADATALVVGNTGAAHVAAAVGTPTVSLFPPTVPAARFRPWMVDHVLLGDQQVPCRNCRARVCARVEQVCLTSVSVDDVLEALRTLGARQAEHAFA
jgi:ADP-heptose:LPS heptosyltransferase